MSLTVGFFVGFYVSMSDDKVLIQYSRFVKSCSSLCFALIIYFIDFISNLINKFIYFQKKYPSFFLFFLF